MHLALHETIDARDQLIETVATTEKLHFFIGICQDQQLSMMLQNHAQHMQQMANRLLSELHVSGQNVNLPPLPTRTIQQPSSQQAWQNNLQTSGIQTGNRTISAGMDHVIAADCLKDCKNLAIKCTVSATEASSPHIRQLHHQACGDHLKMGEELYHYMERRGWYHSPQMPQPLFQQVAQHMPQDLPQPQIANYVS